MHALRHRPLTVQRERKPTPFWAYCVVGIDSVKVLSDPDVRNDRILHPHKAVIIPHWIVGCEHCLLVVRAPALYFVCFSAHNAGPLVEVSLLIHIRAAEPIKEQSDPPLSVVAIYHLLFHALVQALQSPFAAIVDVARSPDITLTNNGQYPIHLRKLCWHTLFYQLFQRNNVLGLITVEVGRGHTVHLLAVLGREHRELGSHHLGVCLGIASVKLVHHPKGGVVRHLLWLEPIRQMLSCTLEFVLENVLAGSIQIS